MKRAHPGTCQIIESDVKLKYVAIHRPYMKFSRTNIVSLHRHIHYSHHSLHRRTIVYCPTAVVHSSIVSCTHVRVIQYNELCRNYAFSRANCFPSHYMAIHTLNHDLAKVRHTCVCVIINHCKHLICVYNMANNLF